MIWQRMISRLTGQESRARHASAANSPRRGKKRRLKLESLQKRELLASDLGSITGVAFIDADGDNTVDVSETLLQNVEVELYLDDITPNGQFDAGETFIGSMTTGPDGTYTFSNLDGQDTVANDDAAEDAALVPANANATTDGLYVITFAAGVGGVEDPAGNTLSGVVLSGDVGVQVTDDDGVTQQAIDTFTTAQPSQPISQGAIGIATSSSGDLGGASGVLGNERDVHVEILANNDPGNADAELVVSTVTNQLSLNSDSDATAAILVQYDGIDADGGGLTLDPIGLRNGGATGVDLSDSDDSGGFTLAIRADDVIADALILRVYTDVGNFSTATVDLPDNLADIDPQTVFVPFTDFVDSAGTGADFANVGAFEAELDSGLVTPGLDFRISILESLRSNEFATVSPATVPLTLGGSVFVDNGGGTDAAEQNNGIQDVGEPVFLATAGNEVVVELYNTDPSVGSPTPIATTTVDLSTDPNPGAFSFTQVDLGAGNVDLGPGTYFVLIPDEEFDVTGPLTGLIGSQVDTPGNGGADVTDDNTDDDNDGIFVTGLGFVSGAIALSIGDEPSGGGNTNTTVDFGVLPVTDLRIDKTINVGASTIEAGGTAVFTVTVTNRGLSDATDISVSDVIPTGLSNVVVRDSSNQIVATTTTTENGLTVRTFDAGTIAAGDPALVFTVTADIDANITVDPLNEVRVSGYEVEANIDTVDADREQGDPVDGALENNIAVELVDVPLAELTITKTDGIDSPATGTAGNNLEYVVVVTNTSTDVAENVIALDTLPDGVTFVAGTFAAGDDGTIEVVSGGADDGKIRISYGNLAASQDETVTITVTIDPAIADNDSPLDNSITVGADNAPDVTANDSTPVVRLTDVTVAKTVISTRTPDDRTDNDDTDDIIDTTAPFQPIAGGFVTYRITATNAGPSEARGVEVTDSLEAELSLVAGSFDAGTSGATIAINGQDLTFTVPDLPSGDSVTFEFEVQIDSNEFDVIPNNVAISTTDPESDANNNTGSVSIDPAPQLDLILDKSVDLTTAVPGETRLTYTFTVSHDTDSISDAVNVDVADTLPAGLTGVTLDAPGATNESFNSNTGVLLVEYASIPVGTVRTFTLTADVNQDATVDQTNSATVTAPGVTELDTNNNSDQVTVTLTPQFDLTIDKSVQGATSVGPNDTVTYTLIVSHDTDDDGTEADNGESPSTATGVVVTDVLPSGLTFVSATSGGAAVTPTNTNGTLVFPEFDLNPGNTQTITVTATVDPTSSGVLNNVSSLVTDAGETETTNNSDNVDITVVPEANVRVSKGVDLTNAQNGTQLTYTVTVFNDGPSPAENVEAVDTLPTGVTFVSGTGPSGALSASGQTVTVNGGTVAANGSFQFTIIATVNDGVTADQINTVAVTTSTAETSTADNNASATTMIDQAINELSGTIFRDFDGDGILDGMDSAIAGIEVLLTGGDLPAEGRRVTTNDNGFYEFTALIAGDYTVQRLDLPQYHIDGLEQDGSAATPADSGDSIDVTVGGTAAADIPDNNFALEPFLSYKLCII